MGVSGFKGNPRGAFVVGFSVLVAVLDTSAVALRFAARRRSKADFAADDWWILSSLIPLYCMIGAGGASKITIPRLDVAPLTQACRQVTSVGGLGRSVNDLSPQQISTFLKIMMCSLLTYSLTITCVKISLLLLYRRIFVTAAFRKRSLVVGIACVAWWITEVFTNIFQCRPFAAAFDPASLFNPERCNNLQAYYTGITASNLGLDLLVLALPLHMVWKLKLPIKRRLILGGIFSMGFLSCIAGALRIVFISNLQKIDMTKSLANAYLWSQIEPATAILCACAVTYGPLFRNLDLSLPKRLLSILSIGKRSNSAASESDDLSSERRLQSHGIRTSTSYQVNVTDYGVELGETMQDQFGSQTTCEAGTPHRPWSPLHTHLEV